jgi:hypothetical protein
MALMDSPSSHHGESGQLIPVVDSSHLADRMNHSHHSQEEEVMATDMYGGIVSFVQSMTDVAAG